MNQLRAIWNTFIVFAVIAVPFQIAAAVGPRIVGGTTEFGWSVFGWIGSAIAVATVYKTYRNNTRGHGPSRRGPGPGAQGS